MLKLSQAVILAGGKGERLLPLTLQRPKPMIVFHGKPFLWYLLTRLSQQGITNVVLLLGYLPDVIINYCGDGSRWGISITYSTTDVSDDTGARIRKAEHLFDDHFLLLYCDNYWPLDLPSLTAFYENKAKRASVVVYSNTDNFTKNNAYVDENGTVIRYDKKRLSHELNGVEIGFYILEKSVISLLPEENVNFEKEILQKLILENELAGYLTHQPYYSVSTLERLARTETYLGTITESNADLL